jgi:hypothetical protein
LGVSLSKKKKKSPFMIIGNKLFKLFKNEIKFSTMSLKSFCSFHVKFVFEFKISRKVPIYITTNTVFHSTWKSNNNFSVVIWVLIKNSSNIFFDVEFHSINQLWGIIEAFRVFLYYFQGYLIENSCNVGAPNPTFFDH